MYLTYVCPNTQVQGLALWDDTAEVFRPVGGAHGHALRYSGAQWVQALRPSDEGYAYYASAFANLRVKATVASIEDPAQYEYFTPCDAGGRCNVTMNASSWAWRRGDLGVKGPDGTQWTKFGPSEEAAAVAGGFLRAEDARMQVVDHATGKPLQPAGGEGGGAGGRAQTILARGSVNWNAHRGAYVLVADQTTTAPSTPQGAGSPAGSASRYGEIWYCEAPAITGPWHDCHRIVTHANTGASCYNPLQLPWLDEGGGMTIYVACTWTAMASGVGGAATDRACAFDMYGGRGCAIAVPRYEYNNLVFKLDVDRLFVH